MAEDRIYHLDPGEVPDAPWRLTPKPRRNSLTREAIVDAALKVLDDEGIEALSMRRVGQELGSGVASLYWHVRNKDELLQLVFERITSELILPEPDPARWKEQLKVLARQQREVFKRHRDAARLSLGRVPAGPTLVVLTEWLLALLAPLGIPDQVIGYIGDLSALYVGAFVFEETLEFLPPTGENLRPDHVVQMFSAYFASLPADRFPHSARAAGALFAGSRDERFEFGIDLMVRGLETYVTRPPE